MVNVIDYVLLARLSLKVIATPVSIVKQDTGTPADDRRLNRRAQVGLSPRQISFALATVENMTGSLAHLERISA